MFEEVVKLRLEAFQASLPRDRQMGGRQSVSP